MAKMSPGAKAARVLTLLMGLRNPRIAAAMASYGFNEAELDEGWALLKAFGKVKVDSNPSSGGGEGKTTIDQLDAWENRWFPITAATLERRFPAIHARVFNNLSQTEGPAVMVSVRTLLERLDAMAAGSYGADGSRAKTQLEARGLTASVMNEARALLEKMGKVEVQSAAWSGTDTSALAKAEEDLWAWYLEWSRIARVAVTQRALLRQLGFLSTRKRTEEDDDEDAAIVTPGVPGSAPLPT
jgi:hypothetical protein